MRDLLKEGTVLELSEHSDGKDARKYRIISFVDEGGSSVCYEAICEDTKKIGKLKEYYPESYASLKREPDSNYLIAGAGTIRTFRDMCSRYILPYIRINEAKAKNKILRNHIQESDVLYPKNYEQRCAAVYIWTTGFEGETLLEYFSKLHNKEEENTYQKLSDVLTAIRSVCLGISALHSTRIMHLDIKPENFLIHYESKNIPNPNIISMFDIDTFRAIGENVPRNLGTDGYIAPEIQKYGRADHRSDIYSIGVMLFYAMVGKEFFEKYITENYEENTAENIIENSKLLYGMSTGRKKKLAAAVTDVIQKCLQENPDRRYESCAKLKKDIEKIIQMNQKISSGHVGNEKTCKDPKAIIEKLLYDHPLYTCLEYAKKQIDILVIGDDKFSKLFMDYALQAAQMHDRKLNIKILCHSAELKREDYMKARPEIKRFVDIDGSAKNDNRVFGKINFVNFQEESFAVGEDKKNIETAQKLIETIPDYIFISFENRSLNRTVAQAVNSVIEMNKRSRPVCYVSERPAPKASARQTGMIPVFIFMDISTASINERLEAMAFNTDRIWSGPLTKDLLDEFEEFKKDTPDQKYKYHSSVSFVLSIKYKLFCAGIVRKNEIFYKEDFEKAGCHFVESDEEAAKLFNELVLSQKDRDEQARKLFSSLVNIEHKRWVLEKITDGWQGVIGGNTQKMIQELLRHSAERGTVHDKKNKIHHCITFSTEENPLNTEEYSRNNKEKWDRSPISSSLDEIDTISISIHQEFSRIIDMTDKALPVEIFKLKNLVSDRGRDIEYSFYQFELCLKHILNGAAGYVKHYSRFKNRLIQEIKLTAPDILESAERYMKEIHIFCFPFLEAYSFRNYKAFDNDLVENIPFILTYRFCHSLAMAFNDGRYENYRNEICFRNVASLTVLYPREVHYFYECDKSSNPNDISHKIEAITGYMSRRNMLSDVHFTILCPKEISVGPAIQDKLNVLKEKISSLSSSVILKDVELCQAENFSEYITQYCRDKNISLFDGTTTLFSSNMENAELTHKIIKENIPYFEFKYRNKQFTCQKGCEYLSYIHDYSYITVNDMFSLMNAFDYHGEIPAFADEYERLWEIYSGKTLEKVKDQNKFTVGVTNWTRLCNILQKQSEKISKNKTKKFYVNQTGEKKNFTFPIYPHCADHAKNIVKELIENRVIDSRSEVRTYIDRAYVSVFAYEAFQENLKEIFTTWDLANEKVIVKNSFNIQQDLVCVVPDILSFENIPLCAEDDKTGQYYKYSKTLLCELEKENLIRNFYENSENKTVSFSFYSPKVKNLLTSAGNILEIYVYYETLKTGFFDDIRTNYRFRWYGGKVENEIDIVTTKGFKSIIVECKATEKLEMNFYHKLYSIADLFGIGTKTVIVNNDYNSNSDGVNALQIERGDQLRIRTFGQNELNDIGILLKKHLSDEML